ncbi:hypothetical protein KUCAC02_002800, partial [Chaenocephalus aceratus]
TLHQYIELHHTASVPPVPCARDTSPLIGLIIETNEQARVTAKSDGCGEQMLMFHRWKRWVAVSRKSSQTGCPAAEINPSRRATAKE